MIDNKKIEDTAKQSSEDSYLSGYFQACYKDAFIDGAKWMQEEFLKDLWHPASEEPKKFRKILYTGGSIDTTDTTMLIINNSWNTKVYLLKIKKWCYIDDLFPKEGGEQ